MKKLLSSFFVFYFVLLGVSSSFAQSEDDFIKNTQNDMILVGAAGVGGAVLGLSTLSFVDTPSKHIRRIWTGAALGIIAGVIYVAYNSAQRGSLELQASRDFSSFERFAWHTDNLRPVTMPLTQISSALFEMSF